MRLMMILIALAAVLPTGPALTAPTHQSVPSSAQLAVDSLLATDRAFSTASASMKLADGLAAMFDDNIIMGVPPGRFATGKAEVITALRANPANANAIATWTPIRGGVSADKKHGFTIGFMTIAEAGKPDRRAKYVSYWIRRPEGWRVAVYKRVGRPQGDAPLDLMTASLPTRALRPARDAATLEAWRLSLDRAERAFSDDAQRIGIGPAFVKHGSPDATNIGGGPGFTVGNDKIGADVGANSGGPGVNWGPADDGVIVAATGDFGITWGLIKPNGPPQAGQPAASPYTTIWRRAAPDQPWRYIAE